MASLQITIEINDEPVAGHALNKLKKYGTDEASVIDRIGRANSTTFPDHKYRPTEIDRTAAISSGVAFRMAASISSGAM